MTLFTSAGQTLYYGGVIPKRPRSCQRAEGSPRAHNVVVGDPSLRLKYGYAQDDAIHERGPDPLLWRRHPEAPAFLPAGGGISQSTQRRSGRSFAPPEERLRSG